MKWAVRRKGSKNDLISGEAKTVETCKNAALRTLKKELPFINPASVEIFVEEKS